MLGLRDSFTLATTKLRIRRVRLIITLIVAGILFTVLVFGSLVTRGATKSLSSFVNDGLLNTFIANIFEPPEYDIYQNKQFIERVEQLEKDRLDQQVAEAKRVGLPFDPKSAPKAVTEYSNPDGTKQKGVDNGHPSARQALIEKNPDTLLARAQAATKDYDVQAIYQGFSFASGGDVGERELAPIIDGKELKQAGYGNMSQDALASFQTVLSATSNDLLKPFVLSGASLESKAGEPIPILAPIDAAEKLLGLKPLSAKAKPAERIARLSDTRARAKNLTFDVCYRNKTAIALRAAAVQQAGDIKAHAADAAYQKPALTYAAPTGACQPTAIASDTRTAEDKALTQKQDQFNEKFGTPKPQTDRITFRIVGILPQLGSLQLAQGPEGIVSAFFTTSLGQGWFASREAALAHPILGSIITDPYAIASGTRLLYANFNTREAQKRFLDEKACELNTNSTPAECKKTGKFIAYAFGNPLAVLQDLNKDARKFFQIALAIIALLSAIVMMGTIGKIIADSRKETSVFRAVGAKRHEIAQIYLLYTLILGSLSFLIALGIGLAAALYVESRYSPGLSVQAVLAFNSHDLHKTFHLIGLHLPDFAVIYAFVVAISLLSAGIPLLANLSRNPVKDMREE